MVNETIGVYRSLKDRKMRFRKTPMFRRQVEELFQILISKCPPDISFLDIIQASPIKYVGILYANGIAVCFVTTLLIRTQGKLLDKPT